MVSTNSITSKFAAFVVDGAAREEPDGAEDFDAITTEVLKRLAPILQYALTWNVSKFFPKLDVHKNNARSLGEFEKHKGILLVRDGTGSTVWYLTNTGKFYRATVRQNTLTFRFHYDSLSEVSPKELFAEMQKHTEHPLDVFFEELYKELDKSITQATERLANMCGRAAWLAEVMSRYESSIDTPRP